MNSLPSIFEVDDTITEVPNYFNQQSAYFMTYKNCLISNKLKNGLVWEPHLHKVFKSLITKNHIVLEAGCHIGSHSILLSKLSKKLMCFEPLSYSADILEKNLKLNKCSNTTIYRKALSDNNDTTIIAYVKKGNPGACVLFKNYESTSLSHPPSEIKPITIDQLNIEELDFIKLDTEGFESKIIQGGWETIKKFRPIITLECWENDFGKYSLNHAQNSFSNLIDLGYNITHLDCCDFLFVPSK